MIQSGQTTIPLDDMFLSDRIVSYLSSQSSASSQAEMRGTSAGYSHTEAIDPFIEQELKWYESNIQYYPLEEQVYRAVARMKNLPQQICMVKLPKKPVRTIKSNFVEEYHQFDDELEQFAMQLNQASPFHMTRIEAGQERERIGQELLALTSPEQAEEENDRWQ